MKEQKLGWIIIHQDYVTKAVIVKEYYAISLIDVTKLWQDDTQLSSACILSITRSK